MAQVNENFLKLRGDYLFAEVARRKARFQQEHPDVDVISLGIGDVTRPLPQAAVEGLKRAASEMADEATFKGYGDYRGYPFLAEKIIEHEFAPRGVSLDVEEIFISEGAKTDTSCFQEVFDDGNVGRCSIPSVPCVDGNMMAGRSGFPTNPGATRDRVHAMHRAEWLCSELPLRRWISYASAIKQPYHAPYHMMSCRDGCRSRKRPVQSFCSTLFEAFIRDDSLPHSIFEIEGADEVAVEFRSFSKKAGFTGTRCAFAVVPKKLKAYASDGSAHSLNALWLRRQTTKFNGVSYPVQVAAAAVYSPEGRAQVTALIDFYMTNARIIVED